MGGGVFEPCANAPTRLLPRLSRVFRSTVSKSTFSVMCVHDTKSLRPTQACLSRFQNAKMVISNGSAEKRGRPWESKKKDKPRHPMGVTGGAKALQCLVKEPKQPQRNLVAEAALDVIVDDKAVRHIPDLPEALAAAANLEKPRAVHQKISCKRNSSPETDRRGS